MSLPRSKARRFFYSLGGRHGTDGENPWPEFGSLGPRPCSVRCSAAKSRGSFGEKPPSVRRRGNREKAYDEHPVVGLAGPRLVKILAGAQAPPSAKVIVLRGVRVPLRFGVLGSHSDLRQFKGAGHQRDGPEVLEFRRHGDREGLGSVTDFTKDEYLLAGGNPQLEPPSRRWRSTTRRWKPEPQQPATPVPPGSTTVPTTVPVSAGHAGLHSGMFSKCDAPPARAPDPACPCSRGQTKRHRPAPRSFSRSACRTRAQPWFRSECTPAAATWSRLGPPPQT